MEFFTVKEFAVKMKMHPRYVTELIREGKIYAIRPGKRHYRISETEIERISLMNMYEEGK